MSSSPLKDEVKVKSDPDDSETLCTPTATPTQTLREKLFAFRFNDELTPSLRRSPRLGDRYTKFEETDSALPTSPARSGPSRSEPYTAPRKRPSSALKTEVKDEDLEDLARAPTKKARTARDKSSKKFAPPEKYAHLDALSDHLGDGSDALDVLFCGINPGQMSAAVGHHFAHPTNHFWKCLHGSQLTERLLSPSEDGTLPANYRIGLTNLVERPSAQAAELANSEFTDGVPGLLRKIVGRRPRIVCFVGKAIWESFIRAAAPPSKFVNPPPTPAGTEASSEFSIEVSRNVATCSDGTTTSIACMGPAPPSQIVVKGKGKARTKQVARKRKVKPTFIYDLQPFKVVHEAEDGIVRETLFFVVVSTSGLVAGYQLPEKIKMFSILKQRRDELLEGTLDTSSMTVIPVPSDLV